MRENVTLRSLKIASIALTRKGLFISIMLSLNSILQFTDAREPCFGTTKALIQLKYKKKVFF